MMPFSSSQSIKKKTTLFSSTENSLIVHGQGIFVFKCPYEGMCSVKFYNQTKSEYIQVQFSPLNIFAIQYFQQKHKTLIDPNNKKGLLNIKGSYYWISLDSQNMTLYAGIGEPRMDNRLFTYKWNSDLVIKHNFLETLVTVSWNHPVCEIYLLRDPITTSIPMKVCNTDECTLDQIDKMDEYLPHTHLHPIGQQLYGCISGKQFKLDTNDFPEFSQAIEHSIKTPGLWCYETLKQKATEFNKDKPNIYETYLRITLGENNGESPGVPYVLEIWPPQHYSPIHNHGGSHAIIRVLHGSIKVHLYPFLAHSEDELQPFASLDFHKDDITWITPNLNQIHRLQNEQNETCITIQSYIYDQDNTEHYDYFDYISERKIQQFEPTSDMRFSDFKSLMKQEWSRSKLIQQASINHMLQKLNFLEQQFNNILDSYKKC